MKNSFAPRTIALSLSITRLVSLLNPIPGWTGPTMHEGLPMRCREERVILQRQSDAAVDAKRSDEAIWMRPASRCIPKSRWRVVSLVPRDPFSYSRRGEIRRGIFTATRETKRSRGRMRDFRRRHARGLTLSLCFFTNHYAVRARLIYISCDSLDLDHFIKLRRDDNYLLAAHIFHTLH